jgi:hypothetical protein
MPQVPSFPCYRLDYSIAELKAAQFLFLKITEEHFKTEAAEYLGGFLLALKKNPDGLIKYNQYLKKRAIGVRESTVEFRGGGLWPINFEEDIDLGIHLKDFQCEYP